MWRLGKHSFEIVGWVMAAQSLGRITEIRVLLPRRNKAFDDALLGRQRILT